MEQVEAIFERIAAGTASEADLATLRRMVRVSAMASGEASVAAGGEIKKSTVVTGDRNVVQVGKYNLQIGEKQDVRIGDVKIYQGPNAETLISVLRALWAEERPMNRTDAYDAPLSLPEPIVPPYFQDREAELQKLQETTGNLERVGVFGLGGTGKTMLAARVAQKVRESAQLKVIWLEVGESYDQSGLLETLARSVGISLQTLPDQKQRASYLRGKTTDAKLLVVLDDVNDDEVANLLLSAIGGGNGVVLTGRDPSMRAVTKHGLQNLILDPLPSEAAAAMLRFLVGAKSSEQYTQFEWTSLAQAVGNLPLALEVIAGDLRFRSVSDLNAYRRQYLDTGEWSKADPTSASLVKAIRASVEQLGPQFVDAFACLGVFVGASLGLRSVTQVCGFESTSEAVSFLAGLQRRMLVRSSADGFFTMHPIVRQATREVLMEREPTARTKQEAINRYLAYHFELLRRHGGYEWNIREYPSLVSQETEIFNAIDTSYFAWIEAKTETEREVYGLYTIRMTSLVSWYLYWRGYWHLRASFCRRVTDNLNRSSTDSRPLGGRTTIGNLYVDEGWARLRWGEIDRAKVCAGEAMRLLAGTSDAIFARELFAQIALETREPGIALRIFEDLTHEVDESTRAWFIFRFKSADALGALGRQDQQEALLEELVSLVPDAKLVENTIITDVQAQIYLRLAKCKAARGLWPESRALLEQSMPLFSQSGTVMEDRVDALVMLAEMLPVTDERVRKRQSLDEALNFAKAMGYLDAIDRIETVIREFSSE